MTGLFLLLGIFLDDIDEPLFIRYKKNCHLVTILKLFLKVFNIRIN